MAIREDKPTPLHIAGGVAVLILVTVGGGLGSCAAFNSIRVWNSTTAGEAELAQATSNRQIKTLEAKAKMASAKYEAQAEIVRAEGVAKANKIIQDSLGGPEGYLRYLQIQAIDTKGAQLIYVPTEAGLPMLEASRLTPKGE